MYANICPIILINSYTCFLFNVRLRNLIKCLVLIFEAFQKRTRHPLAFQKRTRHPLTSFKNIKYEVVTFSLDNLAVKVIILL